MRIIFKTSYIYFFFSFTVIRSSQPVTVRAEYGPFESSHMVPTQYLVPDLMEEPNVQDNDTDGNKKKAALITDFKPHQLDLSAHLVTNEVIKNLLGKCFRAGSCASQLEA